MIFVYNLVMMTALAVLAPIWIPLVRFREKTRAIFLKRLFMDPLKSGGDQTPSNAKRGRIWIHALSVGEVLSAQPLVSALAREYGAQSLVFTASTQTGFETAIRVMAHQVGAVRYFPYDTLFSVDRALSIIRPCRVVIVETDLWPNFLFRLSKRCIPVYLVNARLSERSFRGYRRIKFIMAPLLSVFERICVQTNTDRQLFRALGVPGEKMVMVGNIKFDQAPISVSSGQLNRLSDSLCLAKYAPIWVAGSTHPGEEGALSVAYRAIREAGMDPVLIVAPRDPKRAMEVRSIFRNSGVDAVIMGQLEDQRSPSRVVVIDRIGILRHLYALADVAFVGGSLVSAGGHNPLEPASVAKPVLFGPHTEDFSWICQALVTVGGAIRVDDAEQLAHQVSRLIQDRQLRLHMGRCAHDLFATNRGAVHRTMSAMGG